MGEVNDILTPDEKKFRQILLYVDDCGKNRLITDKNDMADQFGQGIFQILHRLEEKGWLEYNTERQCYYIKDAGIEALDTRLNPEYREKQQGKETKEENSLFKTWH